MKRQTELQEKRRRLPWGMSESAPLRCSIAGERGRTLILVSVLSGRRSRRSQSSSPLLYSSLLSLSPSFLSHFSSFPFLSLNSEGRGIEATNKGNAVDGSVRCAGGGRTDGRRWRARERDRPGRTRRGRDNRQRRRRVKRPKEEDKKDGK